MHTHTYAHTNTHAYIHAYTHKCTSIHEQLRHIYNTHKTSRTQAHKHIKNSNEHMQHKYIIIACTHALTRTHTHKHTHTYAHTRVYKY